MSSDLSSRINQILKLWPPGTVALSSWLESQGVYQQLAARYEKTQWLERVGSGAFTRAGEIVEWPGALYAIQKQAKLPIHAAGKTALELQGHTHFIVAGKKDLFLFGEPRAPLPTWFKKKDWGVNVRYAAPQLFSDPQDQGLTEQQFKTFSIHVSSRERAILEVLYFVPEQQSFEESKLLFEGLRTLRPSLVQTLLEACKSIKVKRLFLHLADATHQPWTDEIKLAHIDLGKGKRVIAGGGKYDSKYNISVPKTKEGGTFDVEAEDGQ